VFEIEDEGRVVVARVPYSVVGDAGDTPPDADQPEPTL